MVLHTLGDIREALIEISEKSGSSTDTLLEELKKSLEPTEEVPINDRYGLHPIKDHDAYKFSQTQENTFWNSTELSFVDDKRHYDRLPGRKKRDSWISFWPSSYPVTQWSTTT